jgi:hypothetical protein
VRVRRAERVEDVTGEVQVLRALVALVADEGGPLARLQGETVAHRDQEGGVGLRQVELLGVPEERPLVVAVAKDADGVVLLRIEAGGDHHPVAQPKALRRVLLQAEISLGLAVRGGGTAEQVGHRTLGVGSAGSQQEEQEDRYRAAEP